jgi:riboflavin synthase
MFTGIISEMGTVVSCRKERDGLRMRIEAPATARGLAIGGSVAVDGVCLTAVQIDRKGFTVQVIPETTRRSTMSQQRFAGGTTRVNLERPLVAGGEIGGHFVQGHVDARARVAGLRKVSKGVVLALELPGIMDGLVVEKGSIAINGVSLTVASVGGGGRKAARHFNVALIPHTLQRTNLGDLESGQFVNLEADILGKYVRTLAGKKR